MLSYQFYCLFLFLVDAYYVIIGHQFKKNTPLQKCFQIFISNENIIYKIKWKSDKTTETAQETIIN